MLKPALTKGDLKVVASTTWEEYRKYFEKDRALMRRFQRVVVVSLAKKQQMKSYKVLRSTTKIIMVLLLRKKQLMRLLS